MTEHFCLLSRIRKTVRLQDQKIYPMRRAEGLDFNLHLILN